MNLPAPHGAFSLVQIIGYFAFASISFGFAQKDVQRLIRFHTLGTALFFIHFIFLGAWPAAGASAINIVRNFCTKFRKQPQRKTWIVALLALAYILNCVIFFHGLVSFVLLAAGFTMITAYFYASGIPQRGCLFLASVFWLTNNYLSHSIGGVCLEALNLGIHTITIWRLLRDEKISRALLQADNAAGELT